MEVIKCYAYILDEEIVKEDGVNEDESNAAAGAAHLERIKIIYLSHDELAKIAGLLEGGGRVKYEIGGSRVPKKGCYKRNGDKSLAQHRG